MIQDKVFEVFSTVMGIPKERVNENTSIEEIEEWDSVQHLNLILSLEEEFSVKFTPEEIQEVLSLKKIIEKIKEKVK